MRRYRERFLVSKGDELVLLIVEDINYFSIDHDHMAAFTDDGCAYPIPMSMADLEQELAPEQFFRINRQFIASIRSIKRISLFFSSKLIVRLKGCPEDKIVISKEQSVAQKKWLDR